MITAQPGFQTDALSTPADIAIYGAAAGVGKSWTLLMEASRNTGIPSMTTMGFRRTSPQIRNPGGLLDASRKIMPLIGGKLRENEMEWKFRTTDKAQPSIVKFSHLQHETD